MTTTTSRPSHAPNVVLIVGTAPTSPQIRSQVRLLPENANPAGHVELTTVHKPRRGPSIWTVDNPTPARRLDAAPAELRASSTHQTTTARPVDRTDELDHAGHVRPAPRIEEPDDFHNRPPL